MIELIAHNIAPIMFVTVMAMLLIGYPVAFTLAAGGLLFFWIGVELSQNVPGADISLFWNLLKAHPERIYGIMYNETLLAIPFFTFMGLILERSGMAEDLLDTIGQLFGSVRGGLAYAVIVVGALLAATTGVVAASVIAMGLISLPIMMRYGYKRSFATGTIAASGTLAQIVPPSLVLIVMADQLGRSVGDMYVGALLPAVIIIALYMLYVFAVTLIKPEWAPALPTEARKIKGGALSMLVVFALSVAIHFALYEWVFDGLRYEVRFVWSATLAALFALAVALINHFFKLGLLSEMSERVILVLMPPLALIFLVLGTIFLGIATPTEGGAMGATGALLMALFKRRLSLQVVYAALLSTTKLSAFVMFILIGARVFGLTFYGVDGNEWIHSLLLQLPGGDIGFLLVVTALVFVLGMFLDFFEIAFIMIPLLAPVAESHGIDLIWFGIILGINLQTSFLTPPFGFALFYLRSISPNKEWRDNVTNKMMPAVRTGDIYRGVVPYIVIQVIVILIVIAFPQLVTHYKGNHATVDPNSVEIVIPDFGGALDGANGGNGLTLPASDGGLPGLALPALDGGLGGLPGGLGGAPAVQAGDTALGGNTVMPELGLGGLPPGLGGEAPAEGAETAGEAPSVDLSTPPVIDLSQPPTISTE